ncbi:MAG TPA: glycosyltransferase [Acidimicrobiales bacterium]|nr:glycosyltransferase [Acidimicrobiales bacterium]
METLQGDPTDEVRRAQADADEWRSRYLALEDAALVRLQSRYRRWVERVAPQGTLRRRLYQRAVSAGRRLLGSPARVAPAAGPPPAPAVEAVVPAPLALPTAADPDVTIVVPVHGQWPMTADCLAAIAADRPAASYEVVVVDDASADDTPQRLAEVAGVRVVRLDHNAGFVGAANAGIAAARGRYVVLLNNDTVCRPGWLDALVATAAADPSVGVVGAKLVYPDGRLQEAGGVIWRDGSGHNYGRDQDPEDPRFNFVRDVDYCSGACLLVRRSLLAELGGLDTRFSPAYYEDTDLCFAARDRGYRVVYQPAAVVCHVEGASHGTDVTTGLKRYQVVNRERFLDKWAAVLPAHGEPAPADPRLSSWRRPAGRALVVDHQVPTPDQDSGSCRMFELLLLLDSLGLGVTFVPQDGVVEPAYRDALASRGIEVLGGPGDLDPYLKAVGPALALVVLSRPTVAWANYPMIRSLVPETTIVYDTVDLHHLRERARAAVEGDAAAQRSADFHYGMELSLARLTDQTWTVSPEERDALLAEEPDLQVAVVPNIHRQMPEAAVPPFAPRAGILFVGNFTHHPNVDAVRWLATEILPVVRAAVPEVTLHLVGANPNAEVRALAGPGIVLHGWVPSMDDVYRQVRLSVAPLRFGAGMKGKVGESLAYGVPVVTTPTGAEGIGRGRSDGLLIADDAAGLARAILQAYGDQALWEQLSAAGRDTIARHFSPDSVRLVLGQILTKLGVAEPPPDDDRR